jgi:dTDP-4-dehydrorhamnose reductase
LVLDSGCLAGAALLEALAQRDEVECKAAPAAALVPPFAQLTTMIADFAPDFLVNCHTIACADNASALEEDHWRYLRFLGQYVTSHNLGLLHLSSAQVFSQQPGRQFAENDPACPDTRIGADFLRAEQQLSATVTKLVVLRCCWVFGVEGPGAFTQFLQSLERGGDIPLYLEERGAPTPAADIARVAIALLLQVHWGAPCWGLYHYCSSDIASSREFAETVMAQAGQYGGIAIDRIRLVEERDPDKRGLPHHPVLVCIQIRNSFGIKQRPWRSALAAMIKRYYQDGKRG